MTPTLTAEGAALGWLVLIALVSLTGLWIADLVSRPRIRPHADDLPAARNLDDHEDAIRGDGR